MTILLAVTGIVLGSMAVVIGLLVWGTNWNSTASERQRNLPGDSFLDGGRAHRVVMTRGITIEAGPEIVWPWLAQIGRGAGWYSYDWLDNGRKLSAQHLVSWIPEPALGDASPIGYLREIVPGEALVWWVEGVRFGGATADLVVSMLLEPRGSDARLLIRVSATAEGVTAAPALLVFRVIDSIMSWRQLRGVRERVESFGTRTADPERPETGALDQFQLYEAIYASGERAGKKGSEHAARWRRQAQDDGVL